MVLSSWYLEISTQIAYLFLYTVTTMSYLIDKGKHKGFLFLRKSLQLGAIFRGNMSWKMEA